MNEAVLVAPRFDEATEYTYAWSQRLKELLFSTGWRIEEVGGGRASRREVEQLLERSPGLPFLFYDHGSEDALWGSEGEAVVDLKNAGLLANRVIYAVACLSAKKLGAVAHSVYGAVYIGYAREFAFNPREEVLFCEAANSGFTAYAKGERDWKKIKELMIESFNKAIEKAGDPWTKLLLAWDRDALRVYAPGADEPESQCVLRRLAIRLFGSRVGWKLSGKTVAGIFAFLIGWGITVHAVASELYYKGGYAEILKPQGEWIGLALVLLGFMLVTWDLFRKI